jgi:hypothetical protein
MKAQLALFGFVLGAALASAPVYAQNPVTGQCYQVPAVNQETEFRVRLLSPISTETSHKGDKITAQVISPDSHSACYMEGQVRESKGGKSKSVLSFYFDTFENMNHSEKIHIASQIKSLANSQGKKDVDDEGNVVKKTNNLRKAALATGAGAVIGALAGGGKGAAIGAGVGAAAALVFIEVGVQAPKVRFAEGSEFVMSVKQRQ